MTKERNGRKKNEIASSSAQDWILAMTMVHGFRIADRSPQ